MAKLKVDRTVAGQLVLLDWLADNDGTQEQIDEAHRTLNLVRWMRRALDLFDFQEVIFTLTADKPINGYSVNVRLLGFPTCCRVEVVVRHEVARLRQNRVNQKGEKSDEAATGESVRQLLKSIRDDLERVPSQKEMLEAILTALAIPRPDERYWKSACPMSLAEHKMVERYLSMCNMIPDRKTVEVTRKSEREFDLIVKYQEAGHSLVSKSAWLPLGAIGELLIWTSSPIAQMTDYPDMVLAGDWSGVRDTEDEKLWAIFEKHVA